MNARLSTPRVRLALLLMIAAVLALVWGYRHLDTLLSRPIPSSGGTPLDLPPLDQTAYFLQYDARWGSDEIGGSGESLSAVGCTVCAIAMACGQLGIDITPGELNARLVACDGYTGQGWLIWDKASVATQGRARAKVPTGFSHTDIDAALQSGVVPLVKFYLAGGAPHWVPIVGKDGTEYLVKDSLDSSMRVMRLSDKTLMIEAVRYVEKT